MASTTKELKFNTVYATITFLQTAERQHSKQQQQSHVLSPAQACTLLFTTHQTDGKRLFVDFVLQTCTSNNSVMIYEKHIYRQAYRSAYDWNRVWWRGCEPEFDPFPPTYIARVAEIGVVLHVQDSSIDYNVHLAVRVDSYDPPPHTLEVHQLTNKSGNVLQISPCDQRS